MAVHSKHHPSRKFIAFCIETRSVNLYIISSLVRMCPETVIALDSNRKTVKFFLNDLPFLLRPPQP